MTTAQIDEAITQADAAAFAEKFQAWTAALTPKERALLDGFLTTLAQAEPGDVQGYMGLLDFVLQWGGPHQLVLTGPILGPIRDAVNEIRNAD